MTCRKYFSGRKRTIIASSMLLLSVFLFSCKSKPENKPDLRNKDLTIKPPPHVENIPEEPKPATFCDVLKALTLDAPNKFNQYKNKQILSDNNQEIWNSNELMKNITAKIILDKENNSTRAEISIYDGLDSALALNAFNEYVKVLDACLPVKKDKLHNEDQSDEESNWNEKWHEYRGDGYTVKLLFLTMRSEGLKQGVMVVVR